MPSPRVDHFKAAEREEGIDPAEAQALFIEAADQIEMLRHLLEDREDLELEFKTPRGTA